jgi:peptidyl-tRNA hydrolase, PTH1 family
MRGIVGLGNPGDKYEKNRHNAGSLLVDAIVSTISNKEWKAEKYADALVVKHNDVLLAKPQTFMNSSGEAVRKLVDFYALDLLHLYVAHDDLDIRLGEYKIQRGVGPKLHNGILSVEEHLHGDQFWRIRIGVDNRTPEKRTPGDIYSLQDFTKSEFEVLKEVNKKIIKELSL